MVARPMSRASGASFEAALLDSVPVSGISGNDAGDRAVGNAMMVRKVLSSSRYNRSATMGAAMGSASLRICALEQGEDLGEGALHERVGEEPLLLNLSGTQVGKLTQADDERAQLLLARPD